MGDLGNTVFKQIGKVNVMAWHNSVDGSTEMLMWTNVGGFKVIADPSDFDNSRDCFRWLRTVASVRNFRHNARLGSMKFDAIPGGKAFKMRPDYLIGGR